MTLEQLRMFVKVVQAGSFTRAAELLTTQKSYASRVVTQLEAELGVQLLERTTRSLRVTEVGREVFERAVGIMGSVDDTARMVQNAQGEARGQLRLTCGVEFGMVAVGPWVDLYLAAYPLVTADVEYTSRVQDLVHEGFDLAIRLGALTESRLVARSLGQLEYGLFTSPGYVALRGKPKTPAQLREHSLVMFSGGSQRKGWLLTPGRGKEREAERIDVTPRLRVNNSFAVRDALQNGLGVGVLPYLIAADSVKAGALIRVMPRWCPPVVAVHAVYPSNRYLSPKVRAFIDLALERFPADTAHAKSVACKA
jgi:LysR family transcriptional regulator, regulator for bpeEF and oprC